MKGLLPVTLLFALLAVASTFTFRDPEATTQPSERNKRRQPLPIIHQIFFGSSTITTRAANNRTSTTIRTTTTTPFPPTSTFLSIQFPTASSNSSLFDINNASTTENVTEYLSLNETENSTVIVASSARSAAVTQACQPENVNGKSGTNSFSYLSDDDIRSKLCSSTNINSTNSWREYRFDLDAKVCSQVGKQSHCGKNMIFYSYVGNSIYGHCDCDYSSSIPLIYHQNTSRCYFMYQQGFCGPDEWLEMTKENGTSFCTKNKCYNEGRTKFGAPPLAARDMAPEYVPFKGNGSCVLLNQPNPQLCKTKGDIVTFRWPFAFYPMCGQPSKKPSPAPEGPPGLSGRFLGDVGSLTCKPGSYLNVIGTCEPEWEFD